jgi:hypothetical protein
MLPALVRGQVLRWAHEGEARGKLVAWLVSITVKAARAKFGSGVGHAHSRMHARPSTTQLTVVKVTKQVLQCLIVCHPVRVCEC